MNENTLTSEELAVVQNVIHAELRELGKLIRTSGELVTERLARIELLSSALSKLSE